jgi:hypothetical protein
LTVFHDGRAIINDSNAIGVAKSIYACMSAIEAKGGWHLVAHRMFVGPKGSHSNELDVIECVCKELPR